MPPPPTRCRYYREDKSAINGGCYREDCAFIHPDDPEWEDARLPWRGGGNSGSWKSSSDFSLTAPTSTNNTKLPETGSRWGSGSASMNKTQGSARMDVDQPRDQPTPWNLSSKDVGWTPSTSTGWGSSSWGEASGSGWGSAPKDPPSGTTSQLGQASQSSPSIDASKRPSTSTWAMDTTEISDPTPPIQKVLPLPGRSQMASAQKPELRRLNTRVQSRLSATPTPSQSSIQTPSPGKRVSFNLPTTLHPTARQLSPTKQTTPMKEKSYPKHYLGPSGRMTLFHDTLIRMQDAIIAQLLYQRACGDNDRWKRTQNSEIYGHATPEARKILDRERNEYVRKFTEAKKKRDNTLAALTELPDLDARRLSPNPNDMMEQVTKYTRELKEWFIEANLPERLTVKKKEEEEKKAKEPAAALAAHEMLHRGEWTWGELCNAVKIVDEKLTSATEEVFSKTTRNCDITNFQDDLQRMISPDLFSRSRMEVSPAPFEQIQQLRQKMDATGDSLEAQSKQAAELFQRLESMKAEYETLVEEKHKINEICDKAEENLVIFEQRKVSAETEIESLKRDLQTLHLRKRASLSAPTIDYEQIVQPLLPVFLEALRDDLLSLFGSFSQRVDESQQTLESRMEEVLIPVMRKTEAIRQATSTL